MFVPYSVICKPFLRLRTADLITTAKKDNIHLYPFEELRDGTIQLIFTYSAPFIRDAPGHVRQRAVHIAQYNWLQVGIRAVYIGRGLQVLIVQLANDVLAHTIAAAEITLDALLNGNI